MPVPNGFFELAALPGALGPFEGDYGVGQASYPVFVRFRLYWGSPSEPVPARVKGYPASVLYGGPAPQEWAMATLPRWVWDWSATLGPPASERGSGTRWIPVLGPVAYLVPSEALAFPWTDFRWHWSLEQQPPASYQIEGDKRLPQFRNLQTGRWDRPGPFGNMWDEKIAGCTCALKTSGSKPAMPTVDSEEVDPKSVTWLTHDEWLTHGDSLFVPWIVDKYSVDIGAVAGASAENPTPIRQYFDRWKCRHMQCNGLTFFAGVHVECGLSPGHPGPHLNPPYCWTDARKADLERPGEAKLGAAKPSKSWFRLHFLDVVTGNEAWAPYQYLTDAAARAWQKKRSSAKSAVIALLERWRSEEGWSEV